MSGDYEQIEKYMKSGLWRLADIETRKALYIACGMSPDDQQRIAANMIPCDVLRDLDQLWYRNSQKRFGFSVQRAIWYKCQDKYFDKTEAWNQFGTKLGWRINHLLKQNYWKPHKELTFTLKAPVGHLPHMGEQFGINAVEGIIQQIDYCASMPPDAQ